jgi:phage N-6-adenine-methyltransferase
MAKKYRDATATRPPSDKQNYETPDEFFDACINLVCSGFEESTFKVDLAAHYENTKCNRFFNEYENSLIQPWHKNHGWLWLNPPFDNIKPWAQKCVEESKKGAKIVMLTPLEATEWAQLCFVNADVRLLIGRLTFKPMTTCFPKPCMISIFDKSRNPSISLWDWRKQK